MKITKQYIKENLINRKGYINANYYKMVSETREELYLIYNELAEAPKCSGGNKCKFQSFTKGYRLTCGAKNCQCYKDRYKRTQETLKKTNLERYGVECNFSLKENKEKERVTKLEKYGDENYNNKKAISKTLKAKTDEENMQAHKKSQKTRLKKYGNKNFRNGIKCKQTKLEKYGDENYNNAKMAQEQKRKTMEEKGHWIPKDKMSDWEIYKLEVRRLTEKTYKEYKDEINPNNYNRVLCGEDGYQLDHIISVYKGFNDNISADIIASKDNLQMLLWKDNRCKWK